MKIKYVCKNWGMSDVKEEVDAVLKILNQHQWSDEEAQKITKMFVEIDDIMECYKLRVFEE